MQHIRVPAMFSSTPLSWMTAMTGAAWTYSQWQSRVPWMTSWLLLNWQGQNLLQVMNVYLLFETGVRGLTCICWWHYLLLIAEKLNIKFVPVESRTGLLTAEETSRIKKLHEENQQCLRIPRRYALARGCDGQHKLNTSYLENLKYHLVTCSALFQ